MSRYKSQHLECIVAYFSQLAFILADACRNFPAFARIVLVSVTFCQSAVAVAAFLVWEQTTDRWSFQSRIEASGCNSPVGTLLGGHFGRSHVAKL